MAVQSYFAMLRAELRGEPFSKSERRSKLLGQLPDRTKGSIEYKHQNISAVLIALGAPYIDGYKPAANFQGLLADVVAQALDAALGDLSQEGQALRRARVGGPARALSHGQAPSVVQLDQKRQEMIAHARVRVSQHIDWIAREEANRAVGLEGERLILEWEKRRLHEKGRRDLATQIVHVSQAEGDGAGYDIRSYFPDGELKLIEVKATRSGGATPFCVTRRELDVSRSQPDAYVLSRVYSLANSPKFFELSGPIDGNCVLEPAVYQARIA